MRGRTGIAKQLFHALFKDAEPNAKYIYSITPYSRCLFNKLTFLEIVKKCPHSKEPKGSLPHSENFATL
jgi:hypothetical protein